MIYFDNAATTNPSSEVLETFMKVTSTNFTNPSSPHLQGQKASETMEKARTQISRYLNVEPEEIIFTSGATESNNLAIDGVVNRYQKRGKRIITTQVEHPSVLEPLKELSLKGYDVVFLPVNKEGKLDLEQFKNALTPDTLLVSIMAVNNETGVIFPIDELAKITKKNSSAIFHTDATQALFKVPFSYKDVDLISMSAHKLNGLKSSGLLVKKKDVDLHPLLLGGGQENSYRSGTSNPPLICALATTVRLADQSCMKRVEGAKALKEYLVNELKKIPEIVIVSPKDSSPFILNFALLKHKASVVVEGLSKKGIMVSTKSACSSKHLGGSYVLRAMGYDKELTENAIRLSFSGYETLAQGQEFMRELVVLLEELKER